MNNLKVTKRIYCNFTAEQWELYTESMDCTQAAMALNSALEQCFNEGMSKQDTLSWMLKLMDKYKEAGASDSEPVWFLEDVLSELYS